MSKLNKYFKTLLIVLVSLQICACKDSGNTAAAANDSEDTSAAGEKQPSILANDSPDTAAVTERRPSKWGTPVKRKGLPNLYKVSDQLYRGAQPTKDGIKELKKLGIKTIVNLRLSHSDRKLLGDSGLSYERIPVNVFRPKKKSYVRFLKIVTDSSKQPVFVHCKKGADRTGVAVASYRIFVQGWDKEEAIKEMRKGGYGFHKIHFSLIKFIRKFKYSPEESRDIDHSVPLDACGGLRDIIFSNKKGSFKLERIANNPVNILINFRNTFISLSGFYEKG